MNIVSPITTRAKLLGIGLIRSQKLQQSLWSGLKSGISFSPVSAAMIGFQAATAERGEFTPAIAGQSAALMVGIPLTGVTSAAVSLIPGVGPLAAVIIGNLLADYGEVMLGNSLARKVRTFTHLYKNIRHLEMGGRYQDTESAQRQRFIAIQDMNSAMTPSRRYLGQEALLMNR